MGNLDYFGFFTNLLNNTYFVLAPNGFFSLIMDKVLQHFVLFFNDNSIAYLFGAIVFVLIALGILKRFLTQPGYEREMVKLSFSNPFLVLMFTTSLVWSLLIPVNVVLIKPVGSTNTAEKIQKGKYPLAVAFASYISTRYIHGYNGVESGTGDLDSVEVNTTVTRLDSDYFYVKQILENVFGEKYVRNLNPYSIAIASTEYLTNLRIKSDKHKEDIRFYDALWSQLVALQSLQQSTMHNIIFDTGEVLYNASSWNSDNVYSSQAYTVFLKENFFNEEAVEDMKYYIANPSTRLGEADDGWFDATVSNFGSGKVAQLAGYYIHESKDSDEEFAIYTKESDSSSENFIGYLLDPTAAGGLTAAKEGEFYKALEALMKRNPEFNYNALTWSVHQMFPDEDDVNETINNIIASNSNRALALNFYILNGKLPPKTKEGGFWDFLKSWKKTSKTYYYDEIFGLKNNDYLADDGKIDEGKADENNFFKFTNALISNSRDYNYTEVFQEIETDSTTEFQTYLNSVNSIREADYSKDYSKYHGADPFNFFPDTDDFVITTPDILNQEYLPLFDGLYTSGFEAAVPYIKQGLEKAFNTYTIPLIYQTFNMLYFISPDTSPVYEYVYKGNRELVPDAFISRVQYDESNFELNSSLTTTWTRGIYSVHNLLDLSLVNEKDESGTPRYGIAAVLSFNISMLDKKIAEIQNRFNSESKSFSGNAEQFNMTYFIALQNYFYFILHNFIKNPDSTNPTVGYEADELREIEILKQYFILTRAVRNTFIHRSELNKHTPKKWDEERMVNYDGSTKEINFGDLLLFYESLFYMPNYLYNLATNLQFLRSDQLENPDALWNAFTTFAPENFDEFELLFGVSDESKCQLVNASHPLQTGYTGITIPDDITTLYTSQTAFENILTEVVKCNSKGKQVFSLAEFLDFGKMLDSYDSFAKTLIYGTKTFIDTLLANGESEMNATATELSSNNFSAIQLINGISIFTRPLTIDNPRRYDMKKNIDLHSLRPTTDGLFPLYININSKFTDDKYTSNQEMKDIFKHSIANSNTIAEEFLNKAIAYANILKTNNYIDFINNLQKDLYAQKLMANRDRYISIALNTAEALVLTASMFVGVGAVAVAARATTTLVRAAASTSVKKIAKATVVRGARVLKSTAVKTLGSVKRLTIKKTLEFSKKFIKGSLKFLLKKVVKLTKYFIFWLLTNGVQFFLFAILFIVFFAFIITLVAFYKYIKIMFVSLTLPLAFKMITVILNTVLVVSNIIKSLLSNIDNSAETKKVFDEMFLFELKDIFLYYIKIMLFSMIVYAPTLWLVQLSTGQLYDAQINLSQAFFVHTTTLIVTSIGILIGVFIYNTLERFLLPSTDNAFKVIGNYRNR